MHLHHLDLYMFANSIHIGQFYEIIHNYLIYNFYIRKDIDVYS
jgi:hypothetical protein